MGSKSLSHRVSGGKPDKESRSCGIKRGPCAAANDVTLGTEFWPFLAVPDPSAVSFITFTKEHRF